MVRNKIIVESSDIVIVFWNKVSPETKNSIEKVTTTMKMLKIVKY